jgi:hypothetical protein
MKEEKNIRNKGTGTQGKDGTYIGRYKPQHGFN